jgi:hypothetical protein
LARVLTVKYLCVTPSAAVVGEFIQ